MKKIFYLSVLCMLPILLQGCGKDRIEERYTDKDVPPPGPTSIAGSIAREEPFRIVEAQGEIDGTTLDGLRTEDIENSALGVFVLPLVAYYKQVNAYIVTTWGDETIRVSLSNVPVGGEAGDVSVDVQDVVAEVQRRGKMSVRTSADVKGNIRSCWNADLTKLERLDCRLEINTILDGKPFSLVVTKVE